MRAVIKYNTKAIDTTSIYDRTAGKEQATINSEVQTSLTGMLDKVYPIGSIYLSVNNVNPSTLFGGTWISFGDSSTYLRLGGDGSGGSNTVTLAANQIPTITTGNQSANHTHTGTTNANNRGHTHSGTTLSAASNGAHEHSLQYWTANDQGKYVTTGGYIVPSAYGGNLVSGVNKAVSAGAHGHSITGSTGGESQNHTHTITTGNNSVNHTHTYTNNSQQNVTIEPKYVQVYAWKRTA